jgi:hypothetical protein
MANHAISGDGFVFSATLVVFTGAIKSEVNLSSSYCCLIIPVVIPKIVCPVEL